jgi:hypothetical protein
MSAPPMTLTVPAAAERARPLGGRRVLWLAGLYYLIGAVAVTMWLWRDPASRIVAGNPYDSDQFAWFFRYDATAVAHLRLPALITTGMNAPQGISIMWNTAMPLPGVLLAPLTLLAGPQASLTALMTLGFAGSAVSMFAVLRRWGAGIAAAGLGGFVYGFSPALIQSSAGHYDLQFAVLPPLIIDAALRLVTGRGGAGGRAAARGGAGLGLAAAAQLFINEEVLLDTAVAAVILTAVLALSRPGAVTGRIRDIAIGAGTAIAVTAAIAGYPLWVQFLGPLRQGGSPFTADFYKNDLAGFVQPSASLLLHTAGSAAFAARFQGGPPEYLGYLGWPMLGVLAFLAARFWRRLPVRATAVTFAALSVLSLGGTLLAAGHEHEGIKLPWYWLQTLPVTAAVIPDRFSIIADGCAAAVFAFGVDAARGRWPRLKGLIAAAAVAAVLPLVPRPLPAAQSSAVPAGWTAAFTALRLPPGASVLVLPMPLLSFTQPLRWQADTGLPASMYGGYYMGPTWSGPPATDGNGLSSEANYLNQLWAQSAGVSVAAVATLPVNQIYPSTLQMKAQLAGWKPAAVVAVTSLDSAFGHYLTALLGPPTTTQGQVLGWRLSWRPGSQQGISRTLVPRG